MHFAHFRPTHSLTLLQPHDRTFFAVACRHAPKHHVYSICLDAGIPLFTSRAGCGLFQTLSFPPKSLMWRLISMGIRPCTTCVALDLSLPSMLICGLFPCARLPSCSETPAAVTTRLRCPRSPSWRLRSSFWRNIYSRHDNVAQVSTILNIKAWHDCLVDNKIIYRVRV